MESGQKLKVGTWRQKLGQKPWSTAIVLFLVVRFAFFLLFYHPGPPWMGLCTSPILGPIKKMFHRPVGGGGHFLT